ncbi:MAG: thioredoxin family protein [Acidocella sp.]|nr:thioredoxin family protein [Acidocella sp.]
MEKVQDMQSIARYGVMRTPAVVIDEKLVHAGGVPSRAEVDGWLKAD